MGAIDDETRRAARLFLDRIPGRYQIIGAWLFGSRARGDHRPDSDADVAVLLSGAPVRAPMVGAELAGFAFDAMLESGVLVSPLPLWKSEWDDPEHFSNPELLKSIHREGIAL